MDLMSDRYPKMTIFLFSRFVDTPFSIRPIIGNSQPLVTGSWES